MSRKIGSGLTNYLDVVTRLVVYFVRICHTQDRDDINSVPDLGTAIVRLEQAVLQDLDATDEAQVTAHQQQLNKATQRLLQTLVTPSGSPSPASKPLYRWFACMMLQRDNHAGIFRLASHAIPATFGECNMPQNFNIGKTAYKIKTEKECRTCKSTNALRYIQSAVGLAVQFRHLVVAKSTAA